MKSLGYNQTIEEQFLPFKNQNQEYVIGRVALEHKRTYRLLTEYGELLAEVSGKLRFDALGREDFPAVGDWCVLKARPDEGRATIISILPRKSKFSRKVAGKTTDEQIVATNIDTVFLVNALNQDFNVRRIERYLLATWESGANPVIVLNKADLCQDIEKKVTEVESVALGVPIIVISCEEGKGVEKLEQFLSQGQTVALLGSSGVGKSTLTNLLVGRDLQEVQDVRLGDDRGRHTTTARELIVIPNKGVLIDTPGMRELQLWEADQGIDHSFRDIEELAEKCQYRDCSHEKEPNCAVKNAIETSVLDQKRYNNYVKLQKELAYVERKSNMKAQLEEKKKWKKISQSANTKKR